MTGDVCAMPMSYSPKQPRPEFGPPTHSSVPEVSGGKVPVTYDESNFKERYLDEYTGEILAPHLIRPAIEDELNYFNSKVWQLSTLEEMEKGSRIHVGRIQMGAMRQRRQRGP